MVDVVCGDGLICVLSKNGRITYGSKYYNWDTGEVTRSSTNAWCKLLYKNGIFMAIDSYGHFSYSDDFCNTWNSNSFADSVFEKECMFVFGDYFCIYNIFECKTKQHWVLLLQKSFDLKIKALHVSVFCKY